MAKAKKKSKAKVKIKKAKTKSKPKRTLKSHPYENKKTLKRVTKVIRDLNKKKKKVKKKANLGEKIITRGVDIEVKNVYYGGKARKL